MHSLCLFSWLCGRCVLLLDRIYIWAVLNTTYPLLPINRYMPKSCDTSRYLLRICLDSSLLPYVICFIDDVYSLLDQYASYHYMYRKYKSEKVAKEQTYYLYYLLQVLAISKCTIWFSRCKIFRCITIITTQTL